MTSHFAWSGLALRASVVALALVACSGDPPPGPVLDAGPVTDLGPAMDAPRDTARADTAAQDTAMDALVRCGMATCMPRSVLVLDLPACCQGGACGLDVTKGAELARGAGIDFPLTGCQPLAQPGPDDARCPEFSTMVGMTTIRWSGCCRPTGACGYHASLRIPGLLDDGPDFGCINAAPFLDGGAPRPCGPVTDGGADGARD